MPAYQGGKHAVGSTAALLLALAGPWEDEVSEALVPDRERIGRETAALGASCPSPGACRKGEVAEHAYCPCTYERG